MSSRMKQKQARRELRRHSSANHPKSVSPKFPNMERWSWTAEDRLWDKTKRLKERRGR